MGVGLFLVGPTGNDWGRRLPSTGAASLPSLASVPLGSGDIMNYLNADAGPVQPGPFLVCCCWTGPAWPPPRAVVFAHSVFSWERSHRWFIQTTFGYIAVVIQTVSFRFSSLTLDAGGMACSYSWSAFQT